MNTTPTVPSNDGGAMFMAGLSVFCFLADYAFDHTIATTDQSCPPSLSGLGLIAIS